MNEIKVGQIYHSVNDMNTIILIVEICDIYGTVSFKYKKCSAHKALEKSRLTWTAAKSTIKYKYTLAHYSQCKGVDI